jgi:hypothetical protein
MIRRRRLLLVCIGVIGLLVNIAIFYPGYMSPDSLSQLSQALGVEPLNDMQPLAMVGVWRILLAITGHSSAMLVLQLGMFWSALTLLAIYLYQEKSSIRLSLVPFAIAGLPFVLNISGVVWKDVQMTFALLLAVVGTLYFKYSMAKRWRWVLLATVVFLLAYACLVRYNALPAIIPLLFWAVLQSQLIPRLKWQWAITGGITAGIVVLSMTVSTFMHVQSSHPDVFVMVDDLTNVSDDQSIQESQLASSPKETILSMRECVAQKQSLTNNYWICANDKQRELLKTEYYNDVKSQWLRTVITHPIDYVLYKANSYALFLFPPKNVYYVWQDGIEKNELGRVAKNQRLGNITEIFVVNFGYKYSPFFFEPWFWLATSAGLMFYAYKRKEVFMASEFLALSAVFYLLSYLPTGATVDYRFVYWPALASVVALLLIFVNYPKNMKKKRAFRRLV